MICPTCNSENTQRLEVIYDSGTHDINTKSNSTGIGFGGGGIGFGLGKTKTRGTSQSGLAQKASPPSKKKIKVQVISILIGLLLLSSHAVQNKMFGGVIMLVGAFFIYKKVSYNSKIFPGLYQSWLNSWLCTKCGNIFS